ncbi:MAG: hypothetical protein U9Q69_01620 [Nanoarchaeota archaeon]|nr:hypothetical protein [Nanoarchaeota archaeon]
MLQKLEEKLKKIPRIEKNKTYEIKFPSGKEKMPIELPYKFPIENPIARKRLYFNEMLLPNKFRL